MNLLPFALALPALLSGNEPSSPAEPQHSELREPGANTVLRLWSELGPGGRRVPHHALARDGERFGPARAMDHRLRLRNRTFDPLDARDSVPAGLRAGADARLWIVQFEGPSLPGFRSTLADRGAEVLRFLPWNAHLVEVRPSDVEPIAALPFVRAVTPFHPAYRIEPELLGIAASEEVTLHVAAVRRGGQAPIEAWIEGRGGRVDFVSPETYLLGATLRAEHLRALAHLDSVLWVDRRGELGLDMNIARVFHGSVFLEETLGLTGRGLRVEVMDAGVEVGLPIFNNVIVHGLNSPSSHGTAVAAIVAGNGMGEPSYRGIIPDCVLVASDFSNVTLGSRYAFTAEIQDPSEPYRCVLQSCSWGSSRTLEYTTISQHMDLILFDLARLSITQSMGNSGAPPSRPEAWAKNIVSVGAINHMNTLSPLDDAWIGASSGPASDGRIKPDLVSFYDFVEATTAPGVVTSFGGNSASTAIIGGHLALFYSLWDLGLFGNENGRLTPFDNRPNNTTAKAVAINTARQWAFSGATHNLQRMNQGWGAIDLKSMYELSDAMLVVDESDVLEVGESTTYTVEVPPGTPELKVTLVYRDPPGVPASAMHRVNDLDLVVTAPDATPYLGNVGLEAGNYSTPGGLRDVLNTVENVFVAAPAAGTWTVRVDAVEVNVDAHVETPGDDVDYALVISGIETSRPPHARRQLGPPGQR